MNNKIKRSIAVTLTAAALCNPLSVTNTFSNVNFDTIIASAADENRPVISGVSHGLAIDDTYEGAQIFYTRSDSRGIVITGCKTTKPGTTIRIPKQIEGRDVVAIANNAFKNQTNIKFVQFYGCNTLYGTQYHPGGSSYGPASFKGASPITEIGEGAF
ncbi:MAG TPA: hypothetical protein P5191_15880, partial [Ruminococcus sp.]|nr:hypothetical protein [Ruminococcus sp.]